MRALLECHRRRARRALTPTMRLEIHCEHSLERHRRRPRRRLTPNRTIQRSHPDGKHKTQNPKRKTQNLKHKTQNTFAGSQSHVEMNARQKKRGSNCPRALLMIKRFVYISSKRLNDISGLVLRWRFSISSFEPTMILSNSRRPVPAGIK